MAAASKSHTLHTYLLKSVTDSKKSFVAMGRLLSWLRQDDNFKDAVGEGVDTWQAYLAQPEVGLSVAEANRLIQIYEYFVVRFGIDEEYLASIPIKNLHYLLPVVKDMEDEVSVNNLLDEAAHLSQRDFKERMHDIRTDDSGIRTYEFIVMRKCIETGSMRKVHGLTSEAVEAYVTEFAEDGLPIY